MSHVVIPIPLWNTGATLRSLPLTVLRLPVPTIDSDEASVAVQWERQHTHNNLTTTHHYRLYDGHLWAEAMLHDHLTPKLLEDHIKDLGEPSSGWPIGLASRMGQNGVFGPPIYGNYHMPTAVSVEDPDTTAGQEAFKQVATIQDYLLVIDGEIWRRCNGPLLEPQWNTEGNKHLKMQFARGVGGRENIDRAQIIFDGVNYTHSIDLITEHYGRLAVKGNPPVQLLDVPPQDQVMFAAAEKAVWHFMWECRNLGGEQENRAIVETLLQAREVLTARWPGHELNFHAKSHNNVAPHLFMNDTPEPGDLQPILAQICSVSSGRFADPVVNTWRLALRRVETWMTAKLDAEQALAGLVL